MSNSALEALLARARDQELASWRWLWVVVAVLAAIHISVVAPFVESSRRRAAAAAALERVEGVAADLAELEVHVGSQGDVVREVMLPALDRLPGEVTGDLRRLEATYRSCAELVASGGRGKAERGGSAPAAAGTGEGDAEPFQLTNVDRILTIGEAETREELLAALAPLVEERIEQPRFSDLERLWSSSAVPRIEASLDGVAARVPELRGRFGKAVEEAPADAGAAWQALGEALAAERRTVRDLAWEPPERRDWWALAEPAAGDKVATRLDPAVEEQLRRPLALDQLEVTATRTESAYRDVVRAVDDERGRLERGARSATLSGVAGRAGESATRAFPLVLGAVLAALMVAAARRRREIGLLVHLIGRRESAPGVVDWYYQRSRWTLALDPSPRREKVARRSGVWRIVAATLAGLAWIALAAFQLRPVEPPERLLATATAGGLALLAAAAYDFSAARALHRMLDQPPPPPPAVEVPAPAFEVPAPAAEAPPSEGEAPGLGGHSLRR